MPRIRLITARAGRTAIALVMMLARRAHPRSRGADWWPLVQAEWDEGSSPLARGGLLPGFTPLKEDRLIPARAGRTCFAALRILPLNFRLIPARAGRTTSAWTVPDAHRAHPRSRGADGLAQGAPQAVWGSSPLARGGLPPIACNRPLFRLIPARAGRTGPPPKQTPSPGAHPRSRGADAPAAGVGLVAAGLIPARAGRTPKAPTRRRGSKAHPRSRGADHPLPTASQRPEGSSPLARGGRHGHLQRRRKHRLIPARAGRTPKWPLLSAATPAHPRSRGADVSEVGDGGVMTRLIPARAGLSTASGN